ncbi:DNA primase [Candidatus Accumulibacter sp. ACC007]|uniref:DNA primase n=1 Tax=Candidatus Accumulibacter sp. ACC007 TaxID=2823333 RepID=UPI0025B9804F|nr:DNA primase [Candidatus Accumulibacter sp. ACC007]
MTPAEKFLSRVEGVRQTAPGRWVFRVPTRKDKRPSGSARELDDGRLLIHDFAGDSTADILAAVGLEMTDLYPECLAGHIKSERRPFLATDALRCVSFEALVCAVAARSMADGKALSATDHDRLILAAERLTSAATVAGL